MLNHLISFSLKNRLLVCILAAFLILYRRAGPAATCRWTPFRTPRRCRCRSTPPRPRSTPRKPSSRSPCRSNRPSAACRAWRTCARSPSSACRRWSPPSTTAPASIWPGSWSPNACRASSCRRASAARNSGRSPPVWARCSTTSVRSTDPARTLTELREIQDWVIKPQLRKVRGVAEVNTWGGFEKQFHVVVDPAAAAQARPHLRGTGGGLQANNQNVGGGQVVRGRRVVAGPRRSAWRRTSSRSATS